MSKILALFVALVAAVPAVAAGQPTSTPQLDSASIGEPAGHLSAVWQIDGRASQAPAVWRPAWTAGSLTKMPEGGLSLARAAAQVQGGDAQSAERKGFIIGFGAGGGLHRSPVRFFSDESTTSFAVLTDFRIGYAPSDQLLLHYSNRVAWTTDSSYDVVGVTGFGTTYMFKPTTPSPFVNGAIGAAIGGNLVQTSNPDRGIGFSVGGGYEFARRLSVDGTAMFVRLGDGRNHTVIAGAFHFLYY